MRLPFLLFMATIVIGCSTETVLEPSHTDETTTTAVATDVATAEPEVVDESIVFVVDVRSKKEWDTGHVEQAVHIPHTEIANRISEVTEDKNAKIVLYCAVGGRAGKAKTKLEELGFTNVENAGGYDDVKQRFK